MQILSPDDVIGQLRQLIADGELMPNAIYDAECKVADREYAYERLYQTEFLKNQGTIDARKAMASLAAADLRLEADLAKAELNRLKNRSKQIDSAGMLVSVISKNVETVYKHS